MYTLVLHAPSSRVKSGSDYKDFTGTLKSGIGHRYAIYKNLRSRIPNGCKVVLLDKDRGNRAEGTLEKLEPEGKAGNGVPLYNVYIRGLQRVPWKPDPERLNRCGVAVL